MTGRRGSDVCVLLLWHQLRNPGQEADGRLNALRRGATPDDSSGVSGGNPAVCVAMLDAIRAIDRKDLRAGRAVAALDTLMMAGPFQFGVDFGNIVIARLHERLGDVPAALRAIRRRPYDWDTAPLYLSTFLREEGRLAALAGDRSGSERAYRHYQMLREGADGSFARSGDSAPAGEATRLR